MRGHMARAVFMALLMGATPTVAGAAGSWIDKTQVPVLRQRGWSYESALLAPPAALPGGPGRITRIAWRYHITPWRPGLEVRLCGAGRCIRAEPERGWSDAFRGQAATTHFHFQLRVRGAGLLRTPLRGGALQLIVNYQ